MRQLDQKPSDSQNDFSYCVRGQVERAFDLVSCLSSKNIQPDGILYNTLLDGCVRANVRLHLEHLTPSFMLLLNMQKFQLCEKVWQSMIKDEVPPSNFTLTIFIKLFGRLGRLNKIFELIENFPSTYNFTVNGHVYTCLMSACISNQRVRVYIL